MNTNKAEWPETILCKYLSELKYEDLSEATVNYTKLLISDYFASVAAGRIVNKACNEMVSKVYDSIDLYTNCHVLYSVQCLTGPNCASMNAFLAHGADMDDGHRIMGGHPGAPIISALLATAEQLSDSRIIDGKDLILAMVCGYEAMIRIGAAVQPEHVGKGFHSTCTVGGAGAAVACAKLLNLDCEQMRNALSLSLVHASGLMTVTETAQSVKPLNAADAAHTGYMCTLFAQAGLTGPDNVLMSKKGFMHAFGGDLDRIRFVTEGMGGDSAINGCYIKLFPTCRATHAGAEAMISMRDKIPSKEDISHIRLNIYPRAIGIAGDERNRVPQTGENAKFSLAFAVASAYHKGGIEIDDIAHYDADKMSDILSICEKIEYVPDASTEDVLHGRRGCRLEVELRDGTLLSKEIVIPKGDPERPVSWEDMKYKFGICVRPILGEERAASLFDVLSTLESRAGVNHIAAMTVKQ